MDLHNRAVAAVQHEVDLAKAELLSLGDWGPWTRARARGLNKLLRQARANGIHPNEEAVQDILLNSELLKRHRE